MAMATVTVGNATKASDLNNTINALLNMLTSNGYLDGSNAPSAADDPGTAGTITYDSGYIYICTATDTWKRIAVDWS
jgi:hypothetical protein